MGEGGLGGVANETGGVTDGRAFGAQPHDDARRVKEPEIVSVSVDYGPLFAI
jgi:hypothetical protein